MIAHDCIADDPETASTLLLDSTVWEFTIEECLGCGLRYLHAFMETQGYSGSGKWVMGEVDQEFAREDPKESELLAYLHGLPRLYYGGSHWGHGGKWAVKNPPNSPIYQILEWDIRDPKYKPRS